jgi:hypothetical protein
MVIAPETVRIFVPLMVIPLLADGALIVILTHAAVVSTVTVMPLFMITSSPDDGTGPPPQVVLLLQLPLTEAVIVAAWVGVSVITSVEIITRDRTSRIERTALFRFML